MALGNDPEDWWESRQKERWWLLECWIQGFRGGILPRKIRVVRRQESLNEGENEEMKPSIPAGLHRTEVPWSGQDWGGREWARLQSHQGMKSHGWEICQCLRGRHETSKNWIDFAEGSGIITWNNFREWEDRPYCLSFFFLGHITQHAGL